ncbi:MAG: MFS transporter [Pseudomonadota bacterium]|nr:MFS transporter [Pseudomonadota bacterium]
MGARLSPYAAVFTSRKILLLLLLGFSSGLPLALTGATLQAWLAVEGVDIKTIGWFALVGQPYVYKFLWAPLMDRYRLPFLGRRRGWLALTQVLLLVSIAWMGTVSPRESPWLLAWVALAVAFLSASQDIVFDAYRADILSADERGPGAAVSVLGYRIAMLVSGGLALILVDNWISWQAAYWLMAALMLVGLAAVWAAAEPQAPARVPTTLVEAVRAPLAEYFSRHGAWLILMLIILYKLGDAFAGTLTTAFLLRGAGFSLTEVGLVNKWLGVGATILGALIGGALMIRLRLYRSLLLFGVLQALTNLGFMLLAVSGKSYALLIAVIAAENLCGGMGTIAFVALLMALCDRRFSATQYALLSALASLGRVYVGPLAGALAATYGWTWFFFFTFVVALPGVLMLWWQRERIEALDISPTSVPPPPPPPSGAPRR